MLKYMYISEQIQLVLSSSNVLQRTIKNEVVPGWYTPRWSVYRLFPTECMIIISCENPSFYGNQTWLILANISTWQ